MIQYKSEFPQIEIKYKKSGMKKVKIQCSKDAADLFRELFNEDTIDYCEEFMVIYLNRVNNTIAWFKVSQGGMSGTVADPKMILVSALNVGASSMLLAHNHPSGNLRPSEADKNLTEKISKAALLLDINVLDHVILSSEGYYSFADEGMLNDK